MTIVRTLSQYFKIYIKVEISGEKRAAPEGTWVLGVALKYHPLFISS